MKLRDLSTLAFGPPDARRTLWMEIVHKFARRRGLHVLPPHMVWTQQPYFLEGKARAQGVKGIADQRVTVLQNCIRSVAAVPGAVAECGVRQGRSTIFLLTADLRQRAYHLFDSFAGLSEPGAEDAVATGAQPWKAGDLSTDEQLARRHLSGFDNVTFHVGWIPDRFPEVADLRFALVHVDVDLYQPTRDTLEFFYDRVEPGGLIVCDDYGSSRCPGARRAFDEFFADRPEGIIELPTGQCIVAKR